MMARFPVLLLIALCLAACCRETVLTETETIYQDRPAWKPIPTEYTEALPTPEAPEHRLTCGDLEDLLDQSLMTIEQCNADRADLRDLQPEGDG